MKYTKGYKFRLYPNKTQATLLNKTLGCCRFIFNHFLSVRRDSWDKDMKSISYTETSALMTKLKSDENYLWLREVDSVALQQSLRDLDASYQNFFKRDRGYPKFKSRRNPQQSYRMQNGGKTIRVESKRIKLPKVGFVRFEQSREFNGRILNATVTRTATGKYFVSLCVEEDMSDDLRQNGGSQIGLDVGLKDFCTDNHGNTFANPKPLRRLNKKLTKAQRKLSRRKLGSHNRNKQRIILARVHEKIANLRKDFLHKLTTKLCRENQTIAVESLNVQGMMKNHKLAQAIADVSWGEFFRQLQYKAILHGCEVIKVSTFYPSSQMCCTCGYKNSLTKDLNVRCWTCPVCGSAHDRDRNAAINILQKALEMKNSA